MIDDNELDEWQRLADAATPGPWRVGNIEKWHVIVPHPEGLAGPVLGERVLLRFNQHFEHSSDAALIAAARTAVPELIAELRRLSAIVRDMAARPSRNIGAWEGRLRQAVECCTIAVPVSGAELSPEFLALLRAGHAPECPYRRAVEMDAETAKQVEPK